MNKKTYSAVKTYDPILLTRDPFFDSDLKNYMRYKLFCELSKDVSDGEAKIIILSEIKEDKISIDKTDLQLDMVVGDLVFCKDCKWKQGAECVMFAEIRPFPDDFCSRGERREDDGKTN